MARDNSTSPYPTTDEVLDGLDLTGRRFVITGASSGLGAEATRAVLAHGASVTMAVRDVGKASAVADQLRVATPTADIEVRPVDLGSLASIRTFADDFLAAHDTLDVLIANAGIMSVPEGRTVDGFETQFGTNHLGHFLLANRLAPALCAAPSGARVVIVSSRAHRMGDVDLDDPAIESTAYDPHDAYARSKTANVLCAVELDRRLAGRGVRAFAVHPGVIADTGLVRHISSQEREDAAKAMPPSAFRSVAAGAATLVWAATSPELDGRGGLYCEDCHPVELPEPPLESDRLSRHAVDPERASALWALSERMVGEEFAYSA